ncbi:MAG: membrane protein insertion efficiency factor YidD [Deltaproteobacteria bacterium]|nr:membrane protein insertion efficiency factor YidD [Deltaproteobacteria bacterium]
MTHMGKTVLIALIRLYQKALSPLLRPACRFHPTCSEYAVEAIRTYGPLRGLAKAAWRILRCNPYSRGGFDPV